MFYLEWIELINFFSGHKWELGEVVTPGGLCSHLSLKMLALTVVSLSFLSFPIITIFQDHCTFSLGWNPSHTIWYGWGTTIPHECEV